MGLFDFLKPKPPANPELDAMMQEIDLAAFPRGPEQIQEEARQLHALLRGRLNLAEASHLLRKTKALLVIAEDRSEERITQSILSTTKGKVTLQEARLVATFLTDLTGPPYSGGDGSSPETAVVINATSSLFGNAAEYSWIEGRYGKREVDWTLQLRSHGQRPDGRYFEILFLSLRNGDERSIHFDITAFYGR
jgi:hypothetical protein